jgi:CII-binding regulator of phage lambda lysogenization HflD
MSVPFIPYKNRVYITYLQVNMSDHTIEELELKDKLKKQEVMLGTLSEKLEGLELTITKLTAECEEALSNR